MVITIVNPAVFTFHLKKKMYLHVLYKTVNIGIIKKMHCGIMIVIYH